MLINIIGFQIGWFSCVLGSANQLPWIGVFISSLVLVAHIVRASTPAFEARLLLAALIIGLLTRI